MKKIFFVLFYSFSVFIFLFAEKKIIFEKIEPGYIDFMNDRYFQYAFEENGKFLVYIEIEEDKQIDILKIDTNKSNFFPDSKLYVFRDITFETYFEEHYNFDTFLQLLQSAEPDVQNNFKYVTKAKNSKIDVVYILKNATITFSNGYVDKQFNYENVYLIKCNGKRYILNNDFFQYSSNPPYYGLDRNIIKKGFYSRDNLISSIQLCQWNLKQKTIYDKDYYQEVLNGTLEAKQEYLLDESLTYPKTENLKEHYIIIELFGKEKIGLDNTIYIDFDTIDLTNPYSFDYDKIYYCRQFVTEQFVGKNVFAHTSYSKCPDTIILFEPKDIKDINYVNNINYLKYDGIYQYKTSTGKQMIVPKFKVLFTFGNEGLK